MGISVSDIVTGRKTFFILPDTSLIPTSYLEDYFALGYECYFVEYDKRVDVKKKVEIILSLFQDVILFFNIDFPLPGVNWFDYIEDLVYHNPKVRSSIGVLYTKRQTKSDKNAIEKRYLYEMGIQCGCIQLEYQKKQNFDLIAKTLFANQAQGRRKTIRALCTPACTYTFVYGQHKEPISGILQDISLSHFTILSHGEPLPIKLYEKLLDIHFNIRGFLFRSDAVLVMERPVNEDMLYVFSFLTSTGANGLDERERGLLIPALYKLLSINCGALLDQYYNKGESQEEVSELTNVDENLIK
ncbi:MAG: hypothetical protein K5907_01345 [Treponema sp.]|nr:hypothetical protein [Treponema sp.]